MAVYFINNPSNGLIKIGHAIDPRARCGSLSREAGVKLEMLGIMDGRREKEKEMHDKFWHLHEVGEWFRRDDDLIAFIRENCHPLPTRQERHLERQKMRGKAFLRSVGIEVPE